jgi:hypothetical protein
MFTDKGCVGRCISIICQYTQHNLTPNIKVTISLGIRTSLKLRKFDTRYRKSKLRNSCIIGIRKNENFEIIKFYCHNFNLRNWIAAVTNISLL